MFNLSGEAEAAKQYAKAYATQYQINDLPAAMELYKEIIERHPDSREASFAWTQIGNIVGLVVPKEDLLEAGMNLARSHFELR